jgi:putative lipase involved disintegration of autophagic bodies
MQSRVWQMRITSSFFGICSAAMAKQLVLRLYDQGLMSRPDLVWIFGETADEIFGLSCPPVQSET